MSTNTIYQPLYNHSWALIIGINDYPQNPLGYARNDATAIARLLCDQFAFPKDQVTVLTDSQATRNRIHREFLKFTTERIKQDDRIIVFFAGHGITKSARRGEVGFLVPVDGNPDDISTLLRWDDLTRNAELIPAKHILFLMDACYGGLAVTRVMSPGNMRFMKGLLQRYARQVLTAGKADELVADGGGPRPGHSLFTGHLLNALEGAAATKEGALTANGVMTYVYDRVGNDHRSQQTPHYGFIEGDGDFIFDTSALTQLGSDEKKDQDILIEIPPVSSTPSPVQVELSTAEQVKEFLTEPRYRIRLDDMVTDEIRRVLYNTDDEFFPAQTPNVTPTTFAERLKQYEAIVAELQTMTILLSKWGTATHRSTLEKIFARLSDNNTVGNGYTVWVGLRWYPILQLMYAGGIAALSAEQYENLAAILTTRMGSRASGDEACAIIIPTVDEIIRASSTDIFKTLSGHERQYVPRSEYMFKALQPLLEDVLFLGRSYESLFDRFEVLFALIYADITYEKKQRVWGPIGRFGWKYSSEIRNNNPFMELVSEAAKQRDHWSLIQAGLFQGSYQRFQEIAQQYEERLKRLQWG